MEGYHGAEWMGDACQEGHTRYSIESIVGKSGAVRRLKEQILQAAHSVSNVLIEGETGSGKELVSHAIHDLSARGGRPLVQVNCAAIPVELAESELFGYDTGAFTGAKVGGKAGKFELANHGTLFLDEISQLSPMIQPKLLRALQEKEVEHVGGVRSIPVDIRLIAATNQPLEPLIQEGKFREDLYYRLNVINIPVPPLRERTEDIPLLVKDLIRRLNAQLGTAVEGISEEALAHFAAYPWPGNIRELQNVLERGMNTKPSGLLTWQEFAPSFERRKEKPFYGLGGSCLPAASRVSAAKRQLEKQIIQEALLLFSGNKKRAAAYLGISRTSLYNKLRSLDIKPEGKDG